MASIQQYEYLLELSKHSTMLSAADALHVSHSGMSMAISNLEKEFGIQLIHRKKNNITLTDEGEKLITILDDFFTALSLWKNQTVVQNQVDLSGEIYLHTSSGIANDILNYIVADLYKSFSNLFISIHQYKPKELIKVIVTKKCELIFAYKIVSADGTVIDPLPSSLTFTPLLQCDMIYHIPKKYSALIEKDVLYEKDFDDYPLILNIPAGDRDKLPHNNTHTIFEGNTSTFTLLLENGIGIGHTISTPFNKKDKMIFKNCVSRKCVDSPNVYFGYITNNTLELSQVNQNLITYITALLASY